MIIIRYNHDNLYGLSIRNHMTMQSFPVSLLRLAALLLIFFQLAGCAATSDKLTNTPDDFDRIHDPLETLNRQMLLFNTDIDKITTKPLAEAYDLFVPEFLQIGLGNFFLFMKTPVHIANNLLQGKVDHAASGVARILLNATLGIGGLIDVATPIGYPAYQEDFGQTLAVWGVPAGPYLILPFLGPSNLRDTTGRAVDYSFNPQTYLLYFHPNYLGSEGAPRLYSIVEGIDQRHNFLGQIELVERGSLDFYASLRNLYHQNRLTQIRDGIIDPESLPDLPDFSDLDTDNDLSKQTPPQSPSTP